MNRNYDDYAKVDAVTSIQEEKDGWYRFADTVFYGEKGGMPSDEGTINGQAVDGLRWQGETLWHHVGGAPLQDPIVMHVDFDKRLARSAAQSALHILDSYYHQKGLLITSTGCQNAMYYDINARGLSEQDIAETEAYMQKAIRQDAPVHFSYVKGSEYKDLAYQKFDEVRIVTIEGLDQQPCGTPHINHTGEIGSFVILDHENHGRNGIRIHFACAGRTTQLLKEDEAELRVLDDLLSIGRKDLAEKVRALLETNGKNKQTIHMLKQQLMDFQARAYAEQGSAVIPLTGEDTADLRLLSQAMARVDEHDRILYTCGDQIEFAIVSKAGRARTCFAALKEDLNCSGGGSDKIVSGRTDQTEEAFLAAVQKLGL